MLNGLIVPILPENESSLISFEIKREKNILKLLPLNLNALKQVVCWKVVKTDRYALEQLVRRYQLILPDCYCLICHHSHNQYSWIINSLQCPGTCLNYFHSYLQKSFKTYETYSEYSQIFCHIYFEILFLAGMIRWCPGYLTLEIMGQWAAIIVLCDQLQ